MMDRAKKDKLPKMQVGFIDSICLPIYTVSYQDYNLASSYMFKFNNRNTRTRCEICLKLTLKKAERRHWRRSDVFIVNFKYISHRCLVFLLLTLIT